jgi:methyltransferase family protein
MHSQSELSERVQPIWTDDDSCLRLGNVTFRVEPTDRLDDESSTSDDFILRKSRALVEGYLSLAAEKNIAKILEIGIFKGGSVVFQELINRPHKIVAVELLQPCDALTEYIASAGKSEIIKPYYGVNQADRRAMGLILSSEFPGQDLDLIVDDGSHRYEPTRDAFNICFPYLKAGGLYIIEDWAWAHWPGDVWQKEQIPFFAGQPAMSNLLVELLMLCASRSDLVENIVVDETLVTITKGNAEIRPEGFDIADHYRLRGRKFWPLL